MHKHIRPMVFTLLFLGMNTAVSAEFNDAVHTCGDHADHPEQRDRAGVLVSWRDKRPGIKQPLKIKILGFNDFHGELERRALGGRPVGGADVLAAYLGAATAEASGNALIIHAGDHVGASPPASALLQDEPSISFLNMLGNRSCREQGFGSLHTLFGGRCNLVGTLGNHEFDEGVREMLRLIEGGNHANGPYLEPYWTGANFPYVSANVVDSKIGHPVLAPFTIATIGGVRIGVIGAVLSETPSIVTPAGVAGVTFLDEAESVNRYARLLKKMGVRTLVVSIHQGARQSSFTGTTNNQPAPLDGAIGAIVEKLHDEVDVVISGHAHGFTNQLVANANGKVILVTQAFSSGTAYADIDLTIDRKTGDVIEKSAEIVTTWADEGPGLAPDAEVAKLVAQATAKVAPLVSRVVGQAVVDLTRAETPAGESVLGNLIADAQRAAMQTDVAFMNPGGIRADVNVGEVTWGDLFSVQPFANDLVRMNLTGVQILRLLNQQWSGANASTIRVLKTSGIRYIWDSRLPAESRVLPDSVTINGNRLSLGGTYSVTVNSFMASGGDNFTVLTEGTDRVVGPVDLDALVQYVENMPQPFGGALEGRIQLAE